MTLEEVFLDAIGGVDAESAHQVTGVADPDREKVH